METEREISRPGYKPAKTLSLSLSLLQVPRHRYTTYAILPCTHALRRLADEILQVRPMAFKVA